MCRTAVSLHCLEWTLWRMRGINSSFWGSCFEKFCSHSKNTWSLFWDRLKEGYPVHSHWIWVCGDHKICGLCIHPGGVLGVNGCCSANGSFFGCRLCCSPEIIMHFQCLWWPLWPWSTHWSTCSQWSLCFPPAWPLQNRYIFFPLLVFHKRCFCDV